MKTKKTIFTALIMAILMTSIISCKTYQIPKDIIIEKEEFDAKRKLYNSLQYKYINNGLINQFKADSTYKDYTNFTLDLKDLENFIKTAKALDIAHKNKKLKFRVYLGAEKSKNSKTPNTTIVYTIISERFNSVNNNIKVQNIARTTTVKTREEIVLYGDRVGHGGNPPQ